MKYRITVKDKATYGFSAENYTEEEAVNAAWDFFNERKPSIVVEKVSDDYKPLWAVVNPDGTFAGVPCESEEEAREMKNQKEGRKIFQMI